nr:MAG TPA: hypothetical protein [Caudoviricetes sp.]
MSLPHLQSLVCGISVHHSIAYELVNSSSYKFLLWKSVTNFKLITTVELVKCRLCVIYRIDKLVNLSSFACCCNVKVCNRT